MDTARVAVTGTPAAAPRAVTRARKAAAAAAGRGRLGRNGGERGTVAFAASAAAPAVVVGCAAAAAGRRGWAWLRARGKLVAAAPLTIPAWPSTRAPDAPGGSAAAAAAAKAPTEALAATAAWAVGAVAPPSLPVGSHAAPASSAKRLFFPRMSDPFRHVSHPVCFVINSSRENSNGRPLASTPRFGESTPTRTVAIFKSSPEIN